jgi:hypothetical protein
MRGTATKEVGKTRSLVGMVFMRADRRKLVVIDMLDCAEPSHEFPSFCAGSRTPASVSFRSYYDRGGSRETRTSSWCHERAALEDRVTA